MGHLSLDRGVVFPPNTLPQKQSTEQIVIYQYSNSGETGSQDA